MCTSRSESSLRVIAYARMEMKPGAKPHCGTNATVAFAANAFTERVLAMSSVKSK